MSTYTLSPSAGRTPTRLPPSSRTSTRSQFRPASSLTASAAAISAASTDWPRNTASYPPSRATLASTSTRGWASGDASSGESATCTVAAPCAPASAAASRAPWPTRMPDASPRDAALDEHAERALLDGAVVVLQKHEGLHSSFLSASRSTTFCAAEPSSSSFSVSPRGGGLPRPRTSVREPPSPTSPDAQAQVGDSEALLRLGLRAHDPLQRRVARLVDRVRDGDDGRQRRGNVVVSELRLPLGIDRAVLHLEPRHLRDERQSQPLGHCGAEHCAVRVGCLLAEQHEVGAFPLERLRKHGARGDEIGPCGSFVGDEHRAVCSHREPLAQGFRGPLRSHGDQHDLTLAGRVAQAQSLLDRVRVEGVEAGLAGAVETHRGGVDSLGPALGNLLHADGNLHRAKTLTARACLSAANRHRQTLLGSGAPSANFGACERPPKDSPRTHLRRGSGQRSRHRRRGRFCAVGGGRPATHLPHRRIGRVGRTTSAPPAGSGSHQGNDLMAPRRTIAVAAEAGKVKYWTSSSAAGCMLYLYGKSGTTYLYIHLNNDVTKGNDNRGKCVPGMAYAKGLKDGRVGRGRRGDRLRRATRATPTDRPAPPLRGASRTTAARRTRTRTS